MREKRANETKPMPEDTEQAQAGEVSRRQMLRSSGAGATLLMVGGLIANDRDEEKVRVLKRGDRVTIERTPKEIIEKAYELGFKYEKEHGG